MREKFDEKMNDITRKVTESIIVNSMQTLHDAIGDNECFDDIISIILTSHMNALANSLLIVIEQDDTHKEPVYKLLNNLKDALCNTPHLKVEGDMNDKS